MKYSKFIIICLSILFYSYTFADYCHNSNKLFVKIPTNNNKTVIDFYQSLIKTNSEISYGYDLVPGLFVIKANNKIPIQETIIQFQKINSIEYVEKVQCRKVALDENDYDKLVISNSQKSLTIIPEIPPVEDPPPEWIKDPKLELNYGTFLNSTRKAWQKFNFYGSPNTIIAIIDTGVDYTHKDLRNNMWRNNGEIGLDSNGNPKETNGIDDDNNGYVDDVVGYDFVNNKSKPYDDYSHGTHVAGIAAGAVGNGFGSAGHCPKCSIMGLKFISADGWGSDEDAIKAIEYAVKMGAHVINSSWGSTEFAKALKDAFEASDKAGIFNSIAAGNEGKDLAHSTYYPAKFRLSGGVTVSALYEIPINIPFWSNYGKSWVHTATAGDRVYSTIPEDKFASFSGTSMAAPGIAGCAGLIKSFQPDISNQEIVKLINKHEFYSADTASKTIFGGRPNMLNILQAIKP